MMNDRNNPSMEVLLDDRCQGHDRARLLLNEEVPRIGSATQDQASRRNLSARWCSWQVTRHPL
jgi:hypothetical protein